VCTWFVCVTIIVTASSEQQSLTFSEWHACEYEGDQAALTLMPLMNRTKHRGPTVVTHDVGDKPGMSCRNAMNRKYMLATLVNCWNRLTGRKLSTVYLAVLMLLPGNPRGSNNPSLVQKSRNDPPGYCMKKAGMWHGCF